ncbi:MAG: hypothetical protein Q9M25_10365 [Mariprofundaceae bacterium]|nr:hypothetical protein [Mariprofundaceae bacterium]
MMKWVMMKRSVVAAAVFLTLGLNACGYHLVGMGRGMVPDDVQVVKIVGVGETETMFLRAWQGFVRDHAAGYTAVAADSEQRADIEMRIGNLKETLAPITYDSAGISTVERMTLTGELSLWRDGERIWNSGSISAYEDVNVGGNPTAIESAKARIRSDLELGWMQQAWLKLSSGF